MACLPLASILAVLAVGAFLGNRDASAQELSKFDRGNARMILKATREDLVKYYYDPSLRGMDVEATFAAADAAITKASTHQSDSE
jgi:hypothetical protein